MIIFFSSGSDPLAVLCTIVFVFVFVFFLMIFGGKCLHALQKLHITTKRIRRLHGDTRITIHDNLNFLASKLFKKIQEDVKLADKKRYTLYLDYDNSKFALQCSLYCSVTLL